MNYIKTIYIHITELIIQKKKQNYKYLHIYFPDIDNFIFP